MATSNDLRLMKNQRESKKKIASPLAKYNSSGQLYCVLCNMPIKSAILWDSHILGKKHKENLAALRAKSAKCQAVTEEQQSAKAKTISSHHSKSSCVQTVLKRANEDKVITGECVPEKKFKGDSNGQKNSVKEREEEDEEEEEEEDENRKRSNMGEEISGLPSDFFDTPRKTEDIMQSKKFNNDDSTEGIPEGFFDDPKLDAKARKVEYKDATEEEWEKFQKAMQVESQVSQSIVDEEDEESRVDREFTELSEQRLYFLRADALRDKQNVVKERILSQKEAQRGQTQKESPATNSDEDSDYEELFDWRAKKVFGHSQ